LDLLASLDFVRPDTKRGGTIRRFIDQGTNDYCARLGTSIEIKLQKAIEMQTGYMPNESFELSKNTSVW
jgi:hypothetical protein